MLNQLNNSKLEFLNKKLQETELNISSDYFFHIDDIIYEHRNSFNYQLNEKLNNIKFVINEINNNTNTSDEFIIAKFYLENNINKKQIEEIYNIINHNNYIDLRNDNFGNMIIERLKNNNDLLFKIINDLIIELINNDNDYNKEIDKLKENGEFWNRLDNIILDNFETILKEIIPTFKFDLFQRLLKLNEIQNIRVLYNRVKYSLHQTMIYYLNLSESNNRLNLPQNIGTDILTFNNIESIIESKRNITISTLNTKLETLLINEKNDIAQKYIENIISDPIFEGQFNVSICDIIKNRLNQNLFSIGEKYAEQMKKNVIDIFISDYTNILDEYTQDINYHVNCYKNELLKKLNFI